MDDINKKLVDGLEQIPTLVQAAKTFKETSNRIVTTLADAIKKRPQAEFTDGELQKLAKIISNTRCASPDMAYISRELARRVSNDVAAIIGSDIKAKAAEALKGASVTVEHSHYVERNLKDIVDKKMKKKILILRSIILALVAAFGISLISYFDGETYWGKQYFDVYTSPYLTQEEKATLKENSILLSVLPRGYRKDAASSRLQIKHMKEELKRREKASKKGQ